MTRTPTHCLLLLTLALGAAAATTTAHADDDGKRDLEGRVQAVEHRHGSFVVQGQRFHVTRSTEFDDDLHSLADLRVGQRVEVEYRLRDGRRIATEVERED